MKSEATLSVERESLTPVCRVSARTFPWGGVGVVGLSFRQILWFGRRLKHLILIFLIVFIG